MVKMIRIATVLLALSVSRPIAFADDSRGFPVKDPPLSKSPYSAPTATMLEQMPHVTVVYYDVFGSTEDELRAQPDTLGPVAYCGYKGDASVSWSLSWNWPGYGRRFCDLGAAVVSYNIEVILPRWSPPDKASPNIITKWANYIEALAFHEKGHVDIVIDNYQSVKEAIERATCETAETAAQAALARIRQLDADYDVATKHGATQGARFP